MDTALFTNLEQLLLAGASPPRTVLITGAPGLGKTRLARQLVSSQPVAHLFQENVFWIALGSTPDVHHLQLRLLRDITRDEGQDRASKQRLADALSRRQSLLVLDDVWNTELISLFDVVSSSNGSRILVTSSQPGVAKELHSENVHVEELTPLTEEQSLRLITSKASEFLPKDVQVTEELDDHLKEAAQACSGNPLALKLLGAAMVSNHEETWKSVQHARTLLPSEVRLFKLLKLGYDALKDEELQRAFVYVAAFPENTPVIKTDLSKCWRGEGFAEHETDWIMEKLCMYELVEIDGDSVTVPRLIREMLVFHVPEAESLLEPGKNLKDVDTRRLMRNHRVISLVGNRLSRISETCVRCSPETRAVLLDGNPLASIHETFTSAFVNLRVLSLRATSITYLPNSIYNLQLLVSLDVSFSKIRIISDALRNMISLEYFDLGNCPYLVQFPVYALQKLTRLAVFNTEGSPGVWDSFKLDWFNRNPGTKFFTLRSISSLVMLERLHVDANIKLALPEGIGELVHLRVLHVALEDVRISPLAQESLPSKFCTALVNLRVLWLGFTDSLQVLPQGLEKLRYLRDLKLKRCSVQVLPEAFSYEDAFDELEEMELASFTSLSSLPAMSQLGKLKTLTFTGCMFKTIPESFSKLTSLSELHLLNCVSLKELPSLERLPQLRYLSLSHCCFNHLPPPFGLPNSFPALKTLSLSSCLDLVTFPELSQGAFPSLESLELKYCSITDLPESLVVLTSLQKLSLKGCTKLKSLPMLTALPKLKHLDLSHVRMEELPEMVASLEKLQELELEGCKLLERIPLGENESSYISLEFLNVVKSGIKVQTLPVEFTSRRCLQIYSCCFIVRVNERAVHGCPNSSA